MRQIRVGDKVRAFLDATIAGEVVEIIYKPAPGAMLMFGGVPPVEAYAQIRLSSGKLIAVRTTELSIVAR